MEARLEAIQATPEPSLALYRTKRNQTISRYRKMLRDLQDAISAESPGAEISHHRGNY